MNLYDAAMLMIVAVCAMQGAWRGMAWQIAPIASLVVGYMFASQLAEPVAPYFGNTQGSKVTALIAVYFAISLAVYLLVRSIKESLDKLKLAEFDHHLGFLFGAVKGVLITLVITFGLVSISTTMRDYILKSESSTIAPRIAQRIAPILPASIREKIDPYLRQLDRGLGPQGASEMDYELAEEPRARRTRAPLPSAGRHLPNSNRNDSTWDDEEELEELPSTDWRRAPAANTTTRRPAATPEDDVWSQARELGRDVLRDRANAPRTSDGRSTQPASRDRNRTLTDDAREWVTDELGRRMNSAVESVVDDIERSVNQPRKKLVPPPVDDDDLFGPSPNR